MQEVNYSNRGRPRMSGAPEAEDAPECKPELKAGHRRETKYEEGLSRRPGPMKAQEASKSKLLGPRTVPCGCRAMRAQDKG